MSTSYDFWQHWRNVAAIAGEDLLNVRPITNATDQSFNAPVVTQTVLQFVVNQNKGFIISRIEGFTHNTGLLSVPTVFDVGAVLELHGNSNQNVLAGTANSLVYNDYLYTFQAGDTVKLDYTDVSGIGTLRACFKWYGWLIPSAKIGNFVNITTIFGGN